MLLPANNICIAMKEKLVKDSGVAGDAAYSEIIQKLLTKPQAKGQFISFSNLIIVICT